MEFISTHRSILKIRLFFGGDKIAMLEMLAPQLELLLITPPVANIYSPLGRDSEVPFPNLKTLRIFTSGPPSDLTLVEFDGLVRARFLPLQHPKSLATHSLHVIPLLVIERPNNVSPEWHESELYEESTRTVTTITDWGTEVVGLRWHT
jgi:hypothetical protein